MPQIIYRISVHALVYIALIISMYILQTIEMLHITFQTAALLITFFAAIQGIVEILFYRLHKGDSKSILFKIMALRSAKFLLYLIISLVFLLSFPLEQKPISFLVIALFTIYTVFELIFMIKRAL